MITARPIAAASRLGWETGGFGIPVNTGMHVLSLCGRHIQVETMRDPADHIG